MENVWNIIQNKLPLNMDLLLDNGLPVFEIRFDKNLNPTGDFYTYAKRKNEDYPVIVRFGNDLNIKETYECASEEELKKWKIDEKIDFTFKPFVSINNKNEIMDIYYYTNHYPIEISRITNKGEKINYKTYTSYSKNVPLKEKIILDKFPNCFIYSYFKAFEKESYGYSVNIPRPTEKHWKIYTILKHNINNLKELDILKNLL